MFMDMISQQNLITAWSVPIYLRTLQFFLRIGVFQMDDIAIPVLTLIDHEKY